MTVGFLGQNSTLIYCLLAFVAGAILIVIASRNRLFDLLFTWFIRLGLMGALGLLFLFYWSYELSAISGIVAELAREFGTQLNFIIGSGIIGAYVGRSLTPRRSSDAV